MFVVFAGIDCSGKTTVSNRVARRLRASGVAVEHVREDGEFASPLIRRQREFGRDPRNLALEPWAELLFYLSRAAQIDAELTRPALARGGLVFADRHVDSYEVLGHHARGLPRERVRAAIEAMSGGLRPDLIVLLDVDPHVARARRKVGKIQSRSGGREAGGSRKGLGGAGAQRRMRDGYLALAAEEPDRWLVIDNGLPDLDLDQVVEAVAEAIRDRLGRARSAQASSLSLVPASGTPGATPPSTSAAEVSSSSVSPSSAVAVIPLERAPSLFYARIEARARREPAVAAYFLTGLADAQAHAWRERLVDAAPVVVGYSLRGLTDPASWRLRERLLDAAPVGVARSLVGRLVDGPQADAMRAALADGHPEATLATLTAADGDAAWQIRDRLQPRAPLAVLASLADIDSARAWALRAAALAGGDAALDEPGLATAMARSLRGLGGDEAWRLRRRAFAAAPVQSIESLAGVLDDEAWAWRRRWIDLAPRAVLASVALLDDPGAWELRGRVAVRVKEALDSMIGMAGDEAWALRDACADIWPSTCVKSLGPLASTPRGAALAARLLAGNADDLSLLKHVTANAHAGSVELIWEEAG